MDRRQATAGMDLREAAPAGFNRWPSPRLAHVTTVDSSLRFLLRDQLHAFGEAGFEVIGVSAPGPWVADLARDGVPHMAVPALRRRLSPLADISAFVTLVTTFRRHHPSIVHTHTPKAGILGRIAARLAGVPIIVHTCHGVYPLEGPKLWTRFIFLLERIAARCSDFELFVNHEDLCLFRRLGIVHPLRSAYLGEGVNVREFDPERVDRRAARVKLGIPGDAVVVGTVGWLVWEKGYREFFAMAEALKREAPGTVILAVGGQDPEKRDAIPAGVIEHLRQRGIVRFLGMRTDMPEVYAAMDIFVLASYREGFPRSAIEAALMGRPLVLTEVRGCRDMVDEGRNGFLVPPRDVERLLASVRILVRNPDMRAQLARESRIRARVEFDQQRVIAATLNVYRQLLGEKGRMRFQTSASKG